MELHSQDLTLQLLSSFPLHSLPHTFIKPCALSTLFISTLFPLSTLGWELIRFPPRDTDRKPSQHYTHPFNLLHKKTLVMISYNFSSNVWWDNYNPKYFKNNLVADDPILKIFPFFF